MNILRPDGFGGPRINYGFYGRQGGVSQGVYASLNCAPHSKDVAENVAENRRRVLQDLGGASLSTLKQIHSSICHVVEDAPLPQSMEGDALVTRIAGQAIGALSADCGPVLFYGEDAKSLPIIGAAHAGWGGALKGVLESTIAAMKELGAVPQTIHAAIGPCIGPASYEVGPDFSTPFLAEDKRAAAFFSPSHFDLPAYLRFRLERAGVSRITCTARDTYSHETEYFSFRRATHRGESDYGRQISAIVIRSD